MATLVDVFIALTFLTQSLSTIDKHKDEPNVSSGSSYIPLCHLECSYIHFKIIAVGLSVGHSSNDGHSIQ